MNANIDTITAALERARQFAALGRGDEALGEYRRILAAQPEHAEALAFHGMHALNRGNPAQAIDWLERAARANPTEPQILLSLGGAFLASRRLDEACATLARCLELAPRAYVARLQYATALEQSGKADTALRQYFGAIVQAQKEGRWLSDASTSPALRPQVKHAMRTAFVGRKRLLESVLAPHVARHGEAAMARVLKCLKIFLGELQANYPDARQRPTFLYFPDLPFATYFDRALFPWYEVLENATDAVREEMNAVRAQPQTLEPFLGDHPPEAMKTYLGGVDDPVWNAYFFYRHGERFDDHHQRCPRTSAALDALPTLVRIREHAPEACYSILTPGTHILKHRGVTNTRLVTHLPLIIPPNCAINVGGEEKVWQIGECFSFDDSIEHEAWNRSGQTRVVMLLDVWNPYLTPPECEAITSLIEGIGDFNASAGIDRQ
jgi:aspartate beta-hydroxylase